MNVEGNAVGLKSESSAFFAGAVESQRKGDASQGKDVLAEIAELARDARMGPLEEACSSFIAAGGAVTALADVLVPAGWRFVICGSGTGVKIIKHEDVLGGYGRNLELAKSWCKLASNKIHHDRIAIELHDLQAFHARMSQFLLPDDNGLGSVDSHIDALFSGTPYTFDGYLIDDSDEFDEDFDETFISVDVD